MNINDLSKLKETFYRYADSFILDKDKLNNPYFLKKEHTKRVCFEILKLARELSLSDGQTMTAEAGALLHDIGRFRQYKEYGTFLDSKSVNHAELGCKVIKEEKMLSFCSDKEREMLLNLVFFHNVFALPEKIDNDTLYLLKLLRDADKLDIWEVVTEHYLRSYSDDNKFISLGLEDDGNISKEVVTCVLKGSVVPSKYVTRLNDLKLLQIGWVFGLNFSESIMRIKEKGCLDKIFSTLPDSEEMQKVAQYVKTYVDENAD